MDTLHVAKRKMDKFATAIEYFHYPTFYTDLEGDILAYNQELLEILGFQAGTDVENIKFIDLIAVEERHFVFRHYEKILLGAGSAVSEVYPLLSRDGIKVDVEITGSLLEDEHGTQYGILFTLQKLSPVGREREIVRQYVYHLKHELKSPLNAVLGFTDLMLRDARLRGEAREYMSLINESGSDMLHMIEGLSELPLKTQNHLKVTFEWFSLDKIFSFIANVGKMLIRQSGKDISLRAVHPADVDLYIYGDKKRMKQILLNLISNAVKFTHTGMVEFGVEENEKEEYEFFVRDTGMGIPEEEQPKIFAPYHQTQNSVTVDVEEGDGIGLSITKHFVEEMGGELYLLSSPNEGSTFYFTLPPFSAGQNKSSQNLDKYLT
ncbi:MAG: PAS domain-containing sensor histidine kinase [Spirochaetia bacterium]